MAKKVEKTKKTNPIVIAWLSRYSDTMEDDDMGRWARVAYAGKFDNGIGFYRNKVARFEIAWVKRIENPKDKNKYYYSVSPDFPFKGKHVHDTLESAQKEVETHFRWFIKMVLKSDKKPKQSLKIGK